MKKCHFCGEIIEDQMKVCPWCGRRQQIIDSSERNLQPQEKVMFCPSCGKQVPDSSRFCLHCGSSISAPVTNTKEEWEYRDFLLQWERGKGGEYYLDEKNNINSIRLQVWNETQSWILPQIQEWLDKGWQPVTEVGPAGFSFRSKNGLLEILTLKFNRGELAEFRVKMRRSKHRTKQ
jgi:RNA polymerase subunit RPABC4/transcription elongation factor Spt4